MGYDVQDGRGRAIAGLNWPWPEQRIALFLPGEESLLLAGQAGWHTLLAGETRSQTIPLAQRITDLFKP